MPIQHDRDSGRVATALLATSFVLTGGMFVITVIVFAFAEDPKQPLLLSAGYISAFVLLLWLFRSGPQNESRVKNLVWMKRTVSDEDAVRYEPMRRRTRRRKQVPNKPPTVESVRALRDGLHNWIPSDRGCD